MIYLSNNLKQRCLQVKTKTKMESGGGYESITNAQLTKLCQASDNEWLMDLGTQQSHPQSSTQHSQYQQYTWDTHERDREFMRLQQS